MKIDTFVLMYHVSMYTIMISIKTIEKHVRDISWK